MLARVATRLTTLATLGLATTTAALSAIATGATTALGLTTVATTALSAGATVAATALGLFRRLVGSIILSRYVHLLYLIMRLFFTQIGVLPPPKHPKSKNRSLEISAYDSVCTDVPPFVRTSHTFLSDADRDHSEILFLSISEST